MKDQITRNDMMLRFREDTLKVSDNIEISATNVDQMNEEQFANIRHNSFGASDSSKILGVNPFPQGSKEDLLYEKIHRLSNDEIGKKATVRMGKDLEPLIIEKLENLTGQTILKPTDMYYNKLTGQSVNFDGISWNEAHDTWIPREIKTVSFFGTKYYNYTKAINLDELPHLGRYHEFLQSFPDSGIESNLDPMQELIIYNAEQAGIPAYYYTQLQQQISFTNAPFGTLTVLDTKSWTMYEFTIERAQPIIDHLAQEAMLLRMKLEKARREE